MTRASYDMHPGLLGDLLVERDVPLETLGRVLYDCAWVLQTEQLTSTST